MTRRALSLPAVAVGLTVVLPFAASCRRSAEQAEETGGTVGVTVQQARVTTLRDVANVSGTVVPASAGDWTIVSTDTAEIVELPKKVQDPVVAGDILVRLDIPVLTQELAALELTVLDASGRADRAKTELTRQTSLFERGIASRNAYDQSRLDLSAAETVLAQARIRLESVKAGEDRAVVRARFNGVVTDVFRAVGDPVRPSPDDPILRVVDPTRVQVAVQLPLAQLARIVVGQKATVQAIAGVNAEPATVVSKAESVNASAPTGEVRLAFTNPATLPLNAPVSTEILFDQRTDALTVPAGAVHTDGLGAFVIVVGDDQRAHRRDIRVGLTTRELAQVLAGLSAGENVVTSAVEDLAEGMPVVMAR